MPDFNVLKDYIFLSIYFVLVTVYVKWIWSRRKLYVLSWKLPGPFSLPFVGSIFILIRFIRYNVSALVGEMKKYTGLVSLWLGPHFCLVITEPDDLESIFSRRVIEKPPFQSKAAVDFLGNGLLSMQGNEKAYKNHKKILNPVFSTINIGKFHEGILKHCEILVEDMKPLCNKGVVDLELILARYVADAVGETLFGVKLDFRKGDMDEYLHISEHSAKAVIKKLSHFWYEIPWLYKMSELYRTEQRTEKMLLDINKSIVVKRREILSKNEPSDELIFTDILLKALDAGLISEKELFEEMHNFWLASFDTITITLHIFVVVIAMHKKHQDKVFEEIKKYFETEEYLKREDLTKFPYLGMCLMETLRFYPPGPLTMRYCSEDVTLKSRNLKIPRGTGFLISGYITHRLPKYWDDPEEFIPERFSKENCAKRHPYSYFPFSAGYRRCIGRIYSKRFILTTMMSILKNYELINDWKFKDIPMTFDIDCRFDWGYKAAVIPRKWD